MNTFKFYLRDAIIFSLESNSTEDAWLWLSQTKNLSIDKVKELYKIKKVDMIKEQMTSVDSSMINKYVYNFASKSLKVEFTSGALYEYNNVEPDLYDNLCKAESAGKFFNEKIKNNFEHVQLLTD